MSAKPFLLAIILFFSVNPLSLGNTPNYRSSGHGPTEPVKIIFDTDMGSDCDDAGALALLHHYVGLGRAEILACVYSSGRVPFGAGIIEAINIRHAAPSIPIAALRDTSLGDPVDKMSAEKLARDTAAWGTHIVHNQDAEDPVQLCRRILASEPDTSVVYLSVGHTFALYQLLVSGPDSLSPLTGRELVKKKVKSWVALGGLGAVNEEGYYARDWNFFFNGSAEYSLYLSRNFPRPVFYVDAGAGVMTGSSLKNTPAGDVVRTVYRDWLWNVFEKTLDDQRPSWDLCAVYFAVNGEGEFLENLGQGQLLIDLEKGSKWISGEHPVIQYYIRQKKGSDDSFADYLNHRILPPELKQVNPVD